VIYDDAQIRPMDIFSLSLVFYIPLHQENHVFTFHTFSLLFVLFNTKKSKKK
jgi:hypothetical protein